MNKKTKNLGFILAFIILPFIFSLSEAKERQAEVTFNISIKLPEGARDVRLWLPYPVSDENQTIEDVKV